MAFDLGELLKNVSDSGTDREQIEYIKLDLIDDDSKNFYSTDEIESLARNIAMMGLLDPLRIRSNPETDGRYLVVSGHRRRLALKLLAQDDPIQWGEVACIYEKTATSPTLQQLRLIFANADNRKMSSSDLNEQAAQVEKLLYQLKEDGYEFPGRMRDHVAQVVQTSKTKLAKLKMIRDNLASCWQPDYKKDILGESTAYELSRMPKAYQTLLHEEKARTNANIKYLYADDVKKFAERAAAIEKMQCKDGGDCTNYENKLRKAAVSERWGWFHCDSKCCRDCPELIRCQRACPKLKDTVARLKADAKAQKQSEQKAAEERDRPIIEKLQDLWLRFGLARQQAGCSVEKVYKTAKMFWASTDDKKVKDLEDGYAKITTNTTLPYGYSFHLSDAQHLIDIADLFGCSLDYLFCRTDVREMAQDAPKEKVPEAGTTQPISTGWYPATVRPEVGADIVIINIYGSVDGGIYMGGGVVEDRYCSTTWDVVKLWSLLPKGGDDDD